MNDDIVKDLFIAIAFKAIDDDKEIRLEKGLNKSESNTLGGAFSKSTTDYDSLSLSVFSKNESVPVLVEEDEDEDSEEEDA